MKKWDDIYFEAFTDVLGKDGYKPSTDESIEIAKRVYNLAIEHAYQLIEDIASKGDKPNVEYYHAANELLKLKQ